MRRDCQVGLATIDRRPLVAQAFRPVKKSLVASAFRRISSNPAEASALCATARLADPTPLFELRRGRAGAPGAKAEAKRRREAGPHEGVTLSHALTGCAT